MVRVHYTYNNRIIQKDVYEAALVLFDFTSRSMEPLESFEPTCSLSQNQFPDSTSTSIVNEEPPIINEQAPIVNEEAPIVNEALPNNNNNNNENVAIVAGRPRGRIPPVAMIAHIIGACSPPFVKQLTQTDVTDGQGRLALHKEYVNRHLVPMFNDDEHLDRGIDVKVYDSEGREYDMTFRLWTKKLYVLTKNWKKFYYTNNLKRAGEYISVWMFRHVENHKLCFVVIQGNVEEH